MEHDTRLLGNPSAAYQKLPSNHWHWCCAVSWIIQFSKTIVFKIQTMSLETWCKTIASCYIKIDTGGSYNSFAPSPHFIFLQLFLKNTKFWTVKFENQQKSQNTRTPTILTNSKKRVFTVLYSSSQCALPCWSHCRSR